VYKIWHKLFGWDYILVNFAFDKVIKRIRVTPNGREYVKIHSYIFFLEERIHTHLTREIPNVQE
jgi:hypothetical protein